MASSNSHCERQFSSHHFREIYKNAWLNKIRTNGVKKSGTVQQKNDRVWVVFCIHDDIEAFLESYSDAKISVTHKPNWFVSLNNTLHISPTICPDDQEYEFVITMPNCVVRLRAPSWEIMSDWVDTLRTKLTEMRILSPCENTYSALPEAKTTLLPTRDPTSPLPAPPQVPAAIVPGIEGLPASIAPSTEAIPVITQPIIATAVINETLNNVVVVETNNIDEENPPFENCDIRTEVTQRNTEFHRTQRPSLIRNHSVPDARTISSPRNITIIQVRDSGPSSASLVQAPVFTFTAPVQVQEAINTTEITRNIPVCRHCDSQCTCSHYDHVFVPDIASLNHSKVRTARVDSSAGSSSGTSRNISNSPSHNPRSPPPERNKRINITEQSNSSRHRSSSFTEVSRSRPTVERLVPEMSRLTLREQQVMRLRKEIYHSDGVRIRLNRKDCLNAIALVDVFGAAWIVGWKQKDNPMLYNLLHIGDQVISVAGIQVHNSADANKHLKAAMCNNLYVEIIVRRVPFGRVFSIQRETEGQSLGIVQENNTAVVREVTANSLAARYGLSQRATTCDGLSFTNWVLTEINGRPLNLFFKNNEVRDRLNALGREISILVQPLDLVKQLKKQLKSFRNYKDYIVQ